MLTQCRRSCGACADEDGDGEADCVNAVNERFADGKDKCEYWSTMGECEKNAAYMAQSCARSCGIHAMVDDDASRRQTSEECRRLCSLYQGCPALDERYVHDPIRDRVIVAPSRRPVSPPSAEALPEDRWNYYDTDERNDLMARVQDEASVEFTRLQDLLDIAAAEDESLWDEYDEYDEYDVAYDDYGEEYDVAYDEYGGDWLDEYDDVYDVGRDVGYDEYGEL